MYKKIFVTVGQEKCSWTGQQMYKPLKKKKADKLDCIEIKNFVLIKTLRE